MGRGLETFWQVALTPVLLLACSPTLELPLDTNILCASDADCPDGWRCEVVVGRCIDPTIVDEEPPVLLAASALDSTVLVLDFSERVDPGSVSTASFAITPSLVVEAAFVESSLRQVRLTTSLQEPGEQYTVTPTGVVDLADNAIEDGSTQTFNGFGAAPDREPPGVLAPRGALPIKPPEVTLVWTRRALARNYTVEVAYDAAFTQLVAGFPIIVEDPDSSLTHIFTQPVRYYWRVRANTTRDGAYGEGSFDRIDSTVYIYCPAGTTCSDVDSRNKPLPGNVSAPLQTIVGAVRLARALGAYEVRIAGRGDGEAYREHVLSGTLDLYGGYDASFTEATRGQTPTIIEDDDGAALFVFGSSTLETVIEDLTLRSARSAALVIASGLNLHINRNDISGGTLGIDASGVTNLLVTGNTIHSYPGSNGSGMRIASSVGVVTDNTIVVETCGAGPCNDPVGVDIDFTSLLFSDNAITVASSGASVDHRGIRIRDGFVEIERNRVSVGDGPSAALEFIGNPYLGASMIRNNILMTGQTLSGSTETYGILAYDPVLTTAQAIFLAVANNLIYAGGGVGTAKAVSDALIGSIYVNNIMLTGPGTNRYCLYENWADLKIADFRNNLLLECPTALYRDVNTSGSTNRTAIADVNIEANTTQTGESASVGGNVTAASLAAVGFVDFPTNVHLTAGTAASIRLGGFNAALNACGLSDFWGCGSVRDDLAKVPRTCPTAGVDCYSIGPYELDP